MKQIKILFYLHFDSSIDKCNTAFIIYINVFNRSHWDTKYL